MRRAVIRACGSPVATSTGVFVPSSIAATAEWTEVWARAPQAAVFADERTTATQQMGGTLANWRFDRGLASSLVGLVRIELYWPNGKRNLTAWAVLDRGELNAALRDGGAVTWRAVVGPDGESVTFC